jgi:hypothetical protein
MFGLLFVAFFATLLILRLTDAPGSAATSGIVMIAFGSWVIWSSVTHHHYGMYVYGPPHFFVLLFGVWLVVKGALRAASY